MKGILAIDSSVIIELLLLSTKGKRFRGLLLNDEITAYTTEYAIMESNYILCRKYGWKDASERVGKLVKSNYVQVKNPDDLMIKGAELKCSMSISLPDCLILSLAEVHDIPAAFSRREKELIPVLDKLQERVKILFLDDIMEE